MTEPCGSLFRDAPQPRTEIGARLELISFELTPERHPRCRFPSRASRTRLPTLRSDSEVEGESSWRGRSRKAITTWLCSHAEERNHDGWTRAGRLKTKLLLLLCFRVPDSWSRTRETPTPHVRGPRAKSRPAFRAILTLLPGVGHTSRTQSLRRSISMGALSGCY